MGTTAIRPPAGRQQFYTTDPVNRRSTYSRACSVEPGGWMLVRVPWEADGREDLKALTPDQRRFVLDNVTPAERSARGR